jgi:hypothetical protein
MLFGRGGFQAALRILTNRSYLLSFSFFQRSTAGRVREELKYTALSDKVLYGKVDPGPPCSVRRRFDLNKSYHPPTSPRSSRNLDWAKTSHLERTLGSEPAKKK